jgi:hypothetical protein
MRRLQLITDATCIRRLLCLSTDTRPSSSSLCVVFTYSICPLFWSRRTNLRPVISVIVIAPAPSIIAFSERLRISPVAFLGIFQQRVGDVRRWWPMETKLASSGSAGPFPTPGYLESTHTHIIYTCVHISELSSEHAVARRHTHTNLL